MKKINYIVLIAIGFTILTGSVAFVVMQDSETEAVKTKIEVPAKDKRASTTTSVELADSSSDTGAAKHTIVIENVEDPRQLQEILTILEGYTADQQIKDLNIKTTKGKVIK